MEAYFVLGCMDLPFAFAIPWKEINSILDQLNTTTTDRGVYWHIHLVERPDGGYEVLLPKADGNLAVDKYRVTLA